ncbi:hypothetical protein [Thiocystis violacea]|uniref:hypothetical protein n=1 Tax=Thiocystis violacea TaxID=13725 RepID=UPI001907DA86|nr:hypothetical protein [Thiocystis violacea]MBK1716664.1 hypothetical protein [Thiocystis violacea]
MTTQKLDDLLLHAAELLSECLNKDATSRQMERAAMMLERCWRSWQREMEWRLFFPFYPAKGKRPPEPLPEIDFDAAHSKDPERRKPVMEQLRAKLGDDGSLDDWPLYLDREAIDAALDGGPVSLFEAAVLIGDRVSCLAAPLVLEAPELFTCAWARGEIDPRHPSTLVKYSDHPGEVPDLSWKLYPEEVDAFAMERWGEAIFARSDPEPVTTEDSAKAERSEPDLGPRTPHTLYRIIRALTLALAKTDPETFEKDGRPKVGCHKKRGTVSGIVGHLIEGKFSDLETTALETHINKALKD